MKYLIIKTNEFDDMELYGLYNNYNDARKTLEDIKRNIDTMFNYALWVKDSLYVYFNTNKLLDSLYTIVADEKGVLKNEKI